MRVKDKLKPTKSVLMTNYRINPNIFVQRSGGGGGALEHPNNTREKQEKPVVNVDIENEGSTVIVPPNFESSNKEKPIVSNGNMDIETLMDGPSIPDLPRVPTDHLTAFNDYPFQRGLRTPASMAGDDEFRRGLLVPSSARDTEMISRYSLPSETGQELARGLLVPSSARDTEMISQYSLPTSSIIPSHYYQQNVSEPSLNKLASESSSVLPVESVTQSVLPVESVTAEAGAAEAGGLGELADLALL